MKVIYLDTKTKVRFTLTKIADEQYKINPLNLFKLGLTNYTEFISLKDLNKLIKNRIIIFKSDITIK